MLTQVIPYTPLIRTHTPPIKMLTQVAPYTPPKNLHTPYVRTTLPCFERSSLPAEPFPCARHSPYLVFPPELNQSLQRQRTRPISGSPPAKIARNAVSRQGFQMLYKSLTLHQSFTDLLPLHSPLHLGSRQQRQQLNK